MPLEGLKTALEAIVFLRVCQASAKGLARAGKRARKNPHLAGLRFGLSYRFLVNMRRIRASVAYIIRIADKQMICPLWIYIVLGRTNNLLLLAAFLRHHRRHSSQYHIVLPSIAKYLQQNRNKWR